MTTFLGRTLLTYSVLIAFCSINDAQKGKFRLASYYSDQMVLQKAPERAVIWGYAPLPSTISVQFNNKEYTSKTRKESDGGQEGVWSVTLDATPQGGPHIITMSCKGKTFINLTDIMFGDVWLCSGQSNMVFRVAQVFNASEEFATASDFADIRVLPVLRQPSSRPLNDLPGVYEKWQRSSPDALGKNNTGFFSAVCWLFAKFMYQHLQRPIGLIESDWGGTAIRVWCPPDVIKKCGEPVEQKMNPEMFPWISREEVKRIPTTASVLWNSMIRPLRNMTIFGALWYQGETDAVENSHRYNCTFPSMVDAWRREFSQSSQQTSSLFPVGFVQLGPKSHDMSYIGGFPMLRKALTADYGYVPNARQKNVFMSVALDLRDDTSPTGSVHYRDKQDAALRLSYAGLAVAYKNRDVHYMSPYPARVSVTSNHSILIEYNLSKLDGLLVDNSRVGFEMLCSVGGWMVSSIENGSNVSVSLSTRACAGHVLQLRYLWRETPCLFKKCPIYTMLNTLPAAPFLLTVPYN